MCLFIWMKITLKSQTYIRYIMISFNAKVCSIQPCNTYSATRLIARHTHTHLKQSGSTHVPSAAFNTFWIEMLRAPSLHYDTHASSFACTQVRLYASFTPTNHPISMPSYHATQQKLWKTRETHSFPSNWLLIPSRGGGWKVCHRLYGVYLLRLREPPHITKQIIHNVRWDRRY